MSRFRLIRVTSLALLAAVALAAPVGAASSRTTTRWVDDDGRAGPTSCHGTRKATTRIQSAVDRSDRNDVIIVCPGRYTGTIGIVGKAHAGLTLRAWSKGSAVIKVPTNVTYGPPIWVERVSGVTVQGLTFEFRATGCDTASGDIQGMWVQDADGVRVQGNRFRTSGADTQGPCGYDDGIRVLSSVGALIANNVLRDFKSDGISFEDGSTGRITGNSIQFYHRDSVSTDDGDQGIRIDRARAVVAENSVRSYASSSRPHLEIGVLVQNGAGTSDIHDNAISNVKTGIGVIASRARIRSNDVLGTGIEYGMFVLSGSGSEVLSNRVRNFDVGIEVDTAGTTLRHNNTRGNGTYSCVDTTTGSGTAGTGNLWSSSNIGSPASDPVGICRLP